MAQINIPDEQRTITGDAEVTAFLAQNGIEFEHASQLRVRPDAPADEVLAAYKDKIDDLKARGGYVTADVIDVFPHTPNLDAMLSKFNAEHWHDEDEVRFIVEGRGLFHIHPPGGTVFAIEVEAGDLIRVPRGTHHWFDLCGDRRIRAIRLFQDPTGWTPHYTGTGVDKGFQPVCFGPGVLRARPASNDVTRRLRDRGVTVVLLDIEGTTTPISFVHDVLFPYARARLASYLGNPASAGLNDVGRQLETEYKADEDRGEVLPPWPYASGMAAAVPYAMWLMDRDRKSPGLKRMQGEIWEVGYLAGELRGLVFDDVPGAIARWHEADIDIAIYSSGSELAQRRLFESTESGDLTRFISGFFDTAVGAKRSAASYATIAQRLSRRPAEILFVSDVAAELTAARDAGLQTVLCVRPGNPPQDARGWEVVERLDVL